MDDRLVRGLTRHLQQAGWIRDYEHARAEAESFANWFARDAATEGVWVTTERLTEALTIDLTPFTKRVEYAHGSSKAYLDGEAVAAVVMARLR